MIYWVQTKALFKGEESDLIPDQPLEETDFSFCMNSVEAFNRAQDDTHTTIWLESGSTITVMIPYDSFMKEMMRTKEN